MGRIEKNANVQKDIQDMKKDVVKTVKPSGSKGKLAVGCAFGALFAIGIFLAWVLWVLASTGLISVPLISSLAYEQPSPTRVVTPGIPLETTVSNDLTIEVNRRVQQGGGVLKDRSISLRLPEDGFTASLRSVLEPNAPEIDASRAQMAISPDFGLELFLPFKNNPQKTAVLMHVRVVPENGQIRLSVDDVWIGAFHLPRFLSRALIDPVVQKNVAQFNAEFGRYATVNDIEYEEGLLTASGEIAVEVLQLQ